MDYKISITGEVTVKATKELDTLYDRINELENKLYGEDDYNSTEAEELIELEHKFRKILEDTIIKNTGMNCVECVDVIEP